MSKERISPPIAADERSTLTSWLDYQRATLAMKCDGLSAEQLRDRAVPPSALSLLGLVRHLTQVEVGWFHDLPTGARVPPPYSTDADPDADFTGVDGADPDEAFDRWRQACVRSREIVVQAPDLYHRGVAGRHSLRWIMIHMIEEYARHNGHADLLRERIDGSVGD
ncbi:MAG TPA: DinB family protein [Mycobacteriales bacterium]|nr:DinB family protein [Mycobacteriales bacterium]